MQTIYLAQQNRSLVPRLGSDLIQYRRVSHPVFYKMAPIKIVFMQILTLSPKLLCHP